MSSIKLLGAQEACGINVGAASTFSSAPNVRLWNSGATARVVTVANAADTTLATISLDTKATLILAKSPTDQIFAAHADILGVGCITEN
tara:strand:+ start:100 stop:366 length:267 start_codon:yes stop_codon:yes gene_type:complete